MVLSQAERLLKSKQHQYVNEHTVCKWAHLCRQEPRLLLYRVVLTFVQQNGNYFTSISVWFHNRPTPHLSVKPMPFLIPQYQFLMLNVWTTFPTHHMAESTCNVNITNKPISCKHEMGYSFWSTTVLT